MLHVALYQPKIPPNTGAIARQCVGMNAHLHIVGPHAFDLSTKAVKRAGLDYWPYLDLTEHATPEAFFDWLGGRQPWLITKFGKYRFDQPAYRDEDVLLFGSELTGLPESIHQRWPDRGVYVPMPGTARGNVRSFNLANTVSILLAQASVTAGLFDA